MEFLNFEELSLGSEKELIISAAEVSAQPLGTQAVIEDGKKV